MVPGCISPYTTRPMKRSDFHYDLPAELIAQTPLSERTASRLLHLDRLGGETTDRQFGDLPGYLRAGDLLVFNNTKVIPARLHGRKETGGRAEILIERLTGERQATAQVRASKSPKAGSAIVLEDGTRLAVVGRSNEFFELQLDGTETLMSVLSRLGHMPLPPYIERPDTADDKTRYQTVYAERPGAVAAPTAGLHFDRALLERIADAGVRAVEVTLHVGAGTFQPVRAEHIEDHRMHAEWLAVPAATVAAVQQAKAAGGRVIAVGTTSVRSLETAAASGSLAAFEGDSRLFIYPGYQFKVVDGMLTNFHLPESTLLMLVCAFAGYENLLAAYRHAVEKRYRFFSYGDAMLLL